MEDALADRLAMIRSANHIGTPGRLAAAGAAAADNDGGWSDSD
jgi:hypothetical protein